MSNYPSPTEQEAMWFRNGERLRAVKSYRARVDIGIAACLGVFGEPPKTVIETEELNALRAEVATLKAEVATLKAERDGARHVRDLAIKDIGRMHGEIKALEASLASARAAAFEEAAKVALDAAKVSDEYSRDPRTQHYEYAWRLARDCERDLATSIRALAPAPEAPPMPIVRFNPAGDVWLDHGDAPSAPPPGSTPVRSADGSTTWQRPPAPEAKAETPPAFDARKRRHESEKKRAARKAAKGTP